jgi:hypothetical protein
MTIATLLLAKLLKLPRRMTGVVGGQRDVGFEMPDGVMLLTDHWHPEGLRDEAAADLPTILIRTPYGRRSQEVFARLLAERGYHVVVQSCRGTFGSGGRWEPLRNEKADGRATLEPTARWRRRSPPDRSATATSSRSGVASTSTRTGWLTIARATRGGMRSSAAATSARYLPRAC